VHTKIARERILGPFVAAKGGGILQLCQTIPLLFGNKNLKTVCLNSFYLNQALQRRAAAV